MATTFAIASRHSVRPGNPLRSERRYSRHAVSLLQFFARHRTAFNDHVLRSFPQHFGVPRTSELHLSTLVRERELSIDKFRSIGRPRNVYCLAPRALETLAGEGSALPLPKTRTRSTGSHLLHELLITEFSVSLQEVIASRSDLQLLWQERFGLSQIPAFAGFMPDLAYLYRCRHGLMFNCVEVLSGQESTTRIRRKLDDFSRWLAEPTAQQFLQQIYGYFGATQPQPLCRLQFVVQNRRTGNDVVRLHQVLRGALDQTDAVRRQTWAATVRDLSQCQTVDDPVWYAGADLDDILPQWNRLDELGQARLLQTTIPTLTRRRLFPIAA